MLRYDRIRLKRAEPMQNFRIVRIANRHLEKERNRIKDNQDKNSRRAPKLIMNATRIFVPDGNWTQSS